MQTFLQNAYIATKRGMMYIYYIQNYREILHLSVVKCIHFYFSNARYLAIEFQQRRKKKKS